MLRAEDHIGSGILVSSRLSEQPQLPKRWCQPLPNRDGEIVNDTDAQLAADSAWTEAKLRRGRLISYGANINQIWRQAAEFVDKILRGAKPGDLPIEQPTKFELVINMKAANALGLTIPQSMLVRADEIIQ